MKKILYIILLFKLLLSCESAKYYDDALPLYDNKLVVNAFVEANNQLALRITKTKAITDYEMVYESYYPNEVKLYESGVMKEILTPLNPNEKLNAFLDFDSVNHRTLYTEVDATQLYQIVIEDEGYGTITSQQIAIPAKPSIKISSYDTTLINGQNLLEIECELRSTQKEYYLLNVYEEQYIDHDVELVYFEIDDPFIGQFDTYTEYAVFSNENFAEVIYFKILIDLYRTKKEPRMFVCLSSITAEGYEYFVDRNKLLTLDPRISEPVKVESNIVNGYGIVIGANTAKDSIINGPPHDPNPLPF